MDKKAVICSMNILLTAATEAEIAPFIKFITQNGNRVSDYVFEYKGNTINICITGVGMVATTYNLTKVLASDTWDFAIQAGIAGSFGRELAIGDVVLVKQDLFGDIGAEDHDKYLDIFELGLLDKECRPFKDGVLGIVESDLINQLNVKRVSGVTVNKVSGTEATIQMLKAKYTCDVESMEGAAFHFVCLQEDIDFAQIRSISNYIEPRDRSKWDIPLAIRKLNDYLISLPFLNS